MIEKLKNEIRAIKGGPKKEFFTDMYAPIDIGDTGGHDAIFNKIRVIRLVKALCDISRESTFGLLYQDVKNGANDSYKKEDLDLGYIIYGEIIKRDI